MTLPFPSRRSYGFLPWSLLALFVVSAWVPAEGQPRRIDPFSPFIGEYTNLGDLPSDAHLWAIGDCNNDSLSDIVVCSVPDQTFHHFGFEIAGWSPVLYKGVRGAIPSVGEAEPIGPIGEAIRADLVGAGDWDDDGYVDVAIRSMRLNDSVYGTSGAGQHELIVYWGSSLGTYRDSDTTHLLSRGDAWMALCNGISEDIDQDGVDDLILPGCTYDGGLARLKGGGVVPAPTMSIFRGRSGERWGRGGVSRRADWEWWKQPVYNRLGDHLVDQNCDGAPDIVMYHDRPVRGAGISILYGTSDGGLPDTNNVETVDLNDPFPPAETSQLFDVTGDAVLDLVVLEDLGKSEFQKIRVYVGEPEEGIKDLYGDGTAPWASIPTPQVLHDGWGGYQNRIYDLGDANDDGFREIYVYHHPFFLSYTTGNRFDSLLDGFSRFDGLFPKKFVNVGDISGRGRDAIAVMHPFGVRFLEGGRAVTNTGVIRFLPHENERRCFSTVSVEGVSAQEEVPSTLNMVVRPNPSSSLVQVRWDGVESRRGGALSVVDPAGQRVHHQNVDAGVEEASFDASSIPHGSYRVVLQVGALSTSQTLILQ